MTFAAFSAMRRRMASASSTDAAGGVPAGNGIPPTASGDGSGGPSIFDGDNEAGFRFAASLRAHRLMLAVAALEAAAVLACYLHEQHKGELPRAEGGAEAPRGAAAALQFGLGWAVWALAYVPYATMAASLAELVLYSAAAIEARRLPSLPRMVDAAVVVACGLLLAFGTRLGER
jgi:hypothetical protein